MFLVDKVLIDKELNEEDDRHDLLTFECVIDYGYNPIDLCNDENIENNICCLKCWCREV
jgi:hypothetical protein